MNERQWELYRLSVVEKWAESPYKRAVLDAIEHKLMVLGQEVRETTVGVGCPKLSPPHSRNLSDSILGRSSIPLNWCDAVSSDRSRTQPHPAVPGQHYLPRVLAGAWLGSWEHGGVVVRK